MLRHSLFGLVASLAVCLAVRAETPAEQEILAKADARIEQHRKADVEIRVIDAHGKPVPGAKVEVSQTQHAFLFGSNIFMWGRIADPKMEDAYRSRFAELLNYCTLGFYWPTYEGKRDAPQHDHARRVAQWCREKGILSKGHPLAWNYFEPRWLPEDLDEVRRLQMARIDDCVARFAGLIDRWDVVNEATHFDRKECIARAPKLSAIWQKLGRVEFTRECFRHARQAGPKATLLVNDYRTDPAYERIIEGLVDDQGRKLYDVIGIQSHMHGGAWNTAKVWDVCDRFSRFQVPLHFTEMTILSGERGWEKPRGTPWPSTPEGEAAQAREVARVYTLLFSHPAVEAITWWDFADYHAWQGAPAGFLRNDMSPKPAYDELHKLIKGRWWTKTSLSTGPEGTAKLRGFVGQYKLTVRAGDRTHTVDSQTITKGANRWEVRL